MTFDQALEAIEAVERAFAAGPVRISEHLDSGPRSAFAQAWDAYAERRPDETWDAYASRMRAGRPPTGLPSAFYDYWSQVGGGSW